MPSLLGLITWMQAAPPAPSKAYSWGLWYVLVVVGAGAFVVFWVIKRVADVAANRKTAAMIREAGEPTDKPDFAPEDAGK